jgi:mannose-6-phosphate isomerase-like protein (cupin superfamily)
LSEYTVVKVSDVPDQGPNLGIAPDVEIRFLRNDLNCQDCGVSYMRIGPNFRQPSGHQHKVQEEIYLLISGSARVKAGDDVVELQPWTAIRVPNGTIRSFESGPEGAEFVIVGAPNTGPGDAIDVEDFWTD